MSNIMGKLLGTGQRRWLVLFPLLGFIILVVLIKSKPDPTLKGERESAPLVKVQKAQLRKLAVVISGYGRAQAKESWQAVAEVTGRVIYRHPDLEKGAMLPAGTLALKIDPVNYQLKLAQAKSDLNSAKADADRIGLNKNKQTLSLGLEKNRLKILEKELKRKQGLVKNGSISRSLVDQEQSNVFAQQQKVLDLETSLKLIPNDIDVAQAKIQVNESRVTEAQIKLEKTQIVIPFDARITQVNAKAEQVINPQSVLLQANHIGAMEIPAQFSFNDMKQLVVQSINPQIRNGDSFPDIKRLNLQADITLYAGETVQQWSGVVTRVSDSMDSQGNTVVLMVEMENDWKTFDPINHPPVLNDMFVQVNVKAKAKEVLSVPVIAIHGQRVYVVEDNVLRTKKVNVLFESGDYAAIAAGEEQGVSVNDWVITTDLLPAVDGMTVRTVTDAQMDKAAMEQTQ
ncbi:MAG: hypothetical protein ACI9FJ_002732 [Alteromonadaceae bacterium]|jgi:hypothetical protein